MNITILCSSKLHPIYPYLERWQKANSEKHDIDLVNEKEYLIGGDILFLISCSEIVYRTDRDLYTKTLVVHAGDLPKGRGWSPHVWQIIEGHQRIVITLFEAEDQVDSGDIWHKEIIVVPEHALYDEINSMVFNTELRLLDFAVDHFNSIIPQPQDSEIEPTYYSKRSPGDSEIDFNASISDQFNILRISDPHRYPAFFKAYGYKYKIIIEKILF